MTRTHLQVRMTNIMARMEMDCDVDFSLKEASGFAKVQVYSPKIVEILQKYIAAVWTLLAKLLKSYS